ncbi:MAG TPA: hypothetical protein EYG11_13485 [Candidatus Latescibacteria bacterium]|nr:hypothetical protein [Candidatus Handelsmanbacteria bacterium]HIL09708.1 hypothetical protein [Candidatus Latescibacterota bacterium]
MRRPQIKLDNIRVQTARMMEIYTLLRGELEKNSGLGPSKHTRSQLDHAIATIHTNMRQILDILTAYQEENSLATEEVQELEELEGILEAVLAWHNEEGE